MPETMEDVQDFESTTVGIYRTAATVKGGRRFSFSALIVVGDRSGRVGMGYGKANQVPSAIEKGQKEARRRARRYPIIGRTLPHTVTGRFGACKVRLVPASPGTGVIAGGAVRAVLEMLGVQDCLTKSFGSNNPKNLVKATLAGLDQLRSKEEVSELRGVELEKTAVEEAIERGREFLPAETPGTEKLEAPKSQLDEKKKGEKRGRRGGRGRKGGGRGKGGKPQATDRHATAGSQAAPPEEKKDEKPVSVPSAPETSQVSGGAPPQGAVEATPPPPPDPSEAKGKKVQEKTEDPTDEAGPKKAAGE